MKKSSLKNYIALLEERTEIAELREDAAAAAHAREYWMRQNELRDNELLEAKVEIAELREDNERLRRHFSDCTEHNHSFERNHNDTQA